MLRRATKDVFYNFPFLIVSEKMRLHAGFQHACFEAGFWDRLLLCSFHAVRRFNLVQGIFSKLALALYLPKNRERPRVLFNFQPGVLKDSLLNFLARGVSQGMRPRVPFMHHAAARPTTRFDGEWLHGSQCKMFARFKVSSHENFFPHVNFTLPRP